MRSWKPSVTIASSRLNLHTGYTDLKTLERFVVLIYDRSPAATGVDEARVHMFARKQRPFDSIPPTQSSLREHAKRAAYQAGVIWGQATCADADIGIPADWGWIKTEEMWKMCWTKLPPIASSCQEVTKCLCKKGCTRRCKCLHSELACTALCNCASQQYLELYGKQRFSNLCNTCVATTIKQYLIIHIHFWLMAAI